jgi:hypothetical protein
MLHDTRDAIIHKAEGAMVEQNLETDHARASHGEGPVLTLAEAVFSPDALDQFSLLTASLTSDHIVKLLSQPIDDAVVVGAIMAYYFNLPHQSRYCDREKQAVSQAWAAVQQARDALDVAQKALQRAESELGQGRIIQGYTPDIDLYQDQQKEILKVLKRKVAEAQAQVDACAKAVQDAQAAYAAAVDVYCHCLGVSAA